jgi:hypothetical protein
MLFRDKNGKLIEINKKNFIYDIDYYNNIASIYGIKIDIRGKPNTMNTILTIVK